MKKKDLNLVYGIFSFLTSAIMLPLSKALGSAELLLLIPLFIALGVIGVYLNYSANKELKEEKKLAEELFPVYFGKNPEKAEVLARPTSKYDRQTLGLSDTTARVKFWSERETYKGIVDMERRVLHMKEPIMMPVYRNESIHVWKEVIEMHENGMPKKVEFYDKFELPHRVDYLDERGILKKGSWRRIEGTMEYWNPNTQVWEPVP